MSLASFVKLVHDKVPFDVEIGIVCGTGLSDLSNDIKNGIVIPYRSIPGFPYSKVEGHHNELVFGQLNGKNVVAMRGRFHFYEGWDVKDVVIGVKLMAALGVRAVIVTNAAGGLDKSFEVGDVMLINDHISFVGMAGKNSLMGMNDESVGPRFPSISSVYDPDFGALFKKCHAKVRDESKHSHELREGCYFGVSGPNYESRHEIQMMRVCGAQAVGMSTVLEVVQAAHCGLKVLGLSLITNKCLGTVADEYDLPEPNHEEVQRETKAVSPFVQAVVTEFVGAVDLSQRPQAKLASKYQRGKFTVPKCPVTTYGLPALIAASVAALGYFGFKLLKK